MYIAYFCIAKILIFALSKDIYIASKNNFTYIYKKPKTMTTQQQTSKALNISLWIAQGFLALMFLMAGAMKSTQAIDQLAGSLPWVAEVPSILVKFIGISEFLGGIGLLLPSILRIQPKLTVYAAIGILVVMILAFVFHIVKGEFSVIGINIFIGLIATFIIWGRTKKVPINPKS